MNLNSPHICYCVSHGFSARMLLQTGLLHSISNAGIKVTLLTTDADSSMFQGKEGFELVQIPHRDSKAINGYFQLRKYMFEVLGENPALMEKHLRRIRRRDQSLIGWCVPRIGLCMNRIFNKFKLLRLSAKQLEERYVFSSKKIGKLLKQLNPDLVISTYPVMPPEPQLLREAKREGISTLIHLLSWDNITCKGVFPIISDYAISWGPIMTKEFESYYSINRSRIFECGVPHFDVHTKLTRENSTPIENSVTAEARERRTIFFAMSAPVFAPREIDVIEFLARRVHENDFGHDVDLVVRPHPQNLTGVMADVSWIRRLKILESDRVLINYPLMHDGILPWGIHDSDMEKYSQLLRGASVVLNSGSTVTIEALLLNKPVIFTSFDGDDLLDYWESSRRLIDFLHIKKLLAYGAVDVAKSYAQLIDQVQSALNFPDRLVKERQIAFEKECGPCDGNATDRVVENIKIILRLQCEQRPKVPKRSI